MAVSSFPTSDDVAGWLPEKMGKKRGARLRLVPTASEFRQETDLVKLISHQATLLESDYAPPVIPVSDLIAVAI